MSLKKEKNIRCNKNDHKCIHQRSDLKDRFVYCNEVRNKNYAVFNCYYLEQVQKKEVDNMPYGGEIMSNEDLLKMEMSFVETFDKTTHNCCMNCKYKKLKFYSQPCNDCITAYYRNFQTTFIHYEEIHEEPTIEVENNKVAEISKATNTVMRILTDVTYTKMDLNNYYYQNIENNNLKIGDIVKLSTNTENKLDDSGERTLYSTGAVRDRKVGKGRCDLLPGAALIRLSKHFEKGSIKYGDSNWKKGIPISSFIDSALRHIFQYMEGEDREDVLCAAAWNLICAMWTEEKHPEMQDIDARIDCDKMNEFEVRNKLLNSLSNKEIICTTKEINEFMELFKKENKCNECRQDKEDCQECILNLFIKGGF